MTATTLLADNGVTSGITGYTLTGGNDGTLQLQTTTAGGTATTAVTINNSQNVGIGTSSPGYTLTVYRGAGSSAYASFAGNASSDALIVGQDTAGLSRIFLNGASPLTFWTNGTERMRITSSGGVCISNSAPTETFVVG